MLADSFNPDDLRARLTRLSGKRLTRFLRVISTFDFLHSLLPSTKRAPSAIRRAPTSECAALARNHAIRVEAEANIDLIVLTQPEHPVAAAFLAGIERLGYVHPYTRLSSLHLPIGARHVFHADLDSLSRPLKEWFLVAATQGANIVTLAQPSGQPSSGDLTGAAPATGADAHDQSDALSESQMKCFPSTSSRLDALLEAAETERFTALVFESDEELRLLHLNWICFSEIRPPRRTTPTWQGPRGAPERTGRISALARSLIAGR